MEAFDDEEIADISIDNAGYVNPEKGEKILLADADTIIFASCAVLAVTTDLLPDDFYTEAELTEIRDDPGYNPEDGTMSYLNLQEAYEHSMDKINSIMERTGTKDFELHFTMGREAFPYTMVLPEYKSDRFGKDSKPAPYGLRQLKEHFKAKHPEKVTINFKWEADHIVVCKKRDFPDKYVMTAVDKDVLFGVAGKHFNYYQSTLYNIDMKWMPELTEWEATVNYYVQTLTGDSGDGVPGLHGIGPVKARKALAKCTDEDELWEATVKMYEKHGKTVVDAITTMRLVNMRQLKLNNDEYEVKLWKPKTHRT